MSRGEYNAFHNHQFQLEGAHSLGRFSFFGGKNQQSQYNLRPPSSESSLANFLFYVCLLARIKLLNFSFHLQSLVECFNHSGAGLQ